MKPWVNILWVPGTNCHHETAHAFKLAGGDPHIILLNRVIAGKERLSNCDLFCLPGGFGNGDHIRAGFIKAIDLVYRFNDQMLEIVEKKIPAIGICNGMQDLASAGLLNGDLGNPAILMDMNESTRFEHWQNLPVVFHSSPGCPWTEGLDNEEMLLPGAHGEGSPVILNNKAEWHIAATYGSYEGETKYPISPNGSRIAGISYGVIFGLMPHPERRVEKRQGGTDGLRIFQNGINAVK
jgi:phosphoribosylformylglycinamidine (FGAM) synthase-like amidotransferase family enzyme